MRAGLLKKFNSLYEIIIQIAAFCVKQVLRPSMYSDILRSQLSMNTPWNVTQMLKLKLNKIKLKESTIIYDPKQTKSLPCVYMYMSKAPISSLRMPRTVTVTKPMECL